MKAKWDALVDLLVWIVAVITGRTRDNAKHPELWGIGNRDYAACAAEVNGHIAQHGLKGTIEIIVDQLTQAWQDINASLTDLGTRYEEAIRVGVEHKRKADQYLDELANAYRVMEKMGHKLACAERLSRRFQGWWQAAEKDVDWYTNRSERLQKAFDREHAAYQDLSGTHAVALQIINAYAKKIEEDAAAIKDLNATIDRQHNDWVDMEEERQRLERVVKEQEYALDATTQNFKVQQGLLNIADARIDDLTRTQHILLGKIKIQAEEPEFTV